jgi:hypothetical protein
VAPAATPVPAESFPEEQPAITMRLAEIPVAPISPEEQLMDFASFGLRVGCQFDSYKATEGSAPLDSMKLFNDESFAVALTAHFGRAGYFTRLDVPAAIGTHTSRVGFGFYPVGVAYLFSDARVMPYVGAGILGGMLYALMDTSTATATTNTTHQRFGIYGQVRTVLGIKTFPVNHFALSFEIGYSPYIIGYLPRDSSVSPKKNFPAETGAGMIWDSNIGVEWQ